MCPPHGVLHVHGARLPIQPRRVQGQPVDRVVGSPAPRCTRTVNLPSPSKPGPLSHRSGLFILGAQDQGHGALDSADGQSSFVHRHCFNLIDFGGGSSRASSVQAGCRDRFRPYRRPSGPRSGGPGAWTAKPAFQPVGGGGDVRISRAAHQQLVCCIGPTDQGICGVGERGAPLATGWDSLCFLHTQDLTVHDEEVFPKNGQPDPPPGNTMVTRRGSRSSSPRRNAPACDSAGANRPGCPPQRRFRLTPPAPAGACPATVHGFPWP